MPMSRSPNGRTYRRPIAVSVRYVDVSGGRWHTRDGAWRVTVCAEPSTTPYFQISHRGRLIANVRRLEELIKIVPLHELVEDGR
jgi:hypothetical protein